MIKSPLTQGCGLKSPSIHRKHKNPTVAPHAGVWIEIEINKSLDALGAVAPHAGVWIEILLV